MNHFTNEQIEAFNKERDEIRKCEYERGLRKEQLIKYGLPIFR